MLGILSSIISGMAMSIQGVFNTRLGEKIGLSETNAIVQGTAFLITLIITFCLGKGNIHNIKMCKKIYLLGGVLGVIITYTVMYGIKSMGATHSIALILVSQLIMAFLIDFFGLFGSKNIKFNSYELVGIFMLIAGIVVLKWNS
ncbi:DMT family transporter [Clostridium sp. LBM24168]